jgi:hypothetical protein
LHRATSEHCLEVCTLQHFRRYQKVFVPLTQGQNKPDISCAMLLLKNEEKVHVNHIDGINVIVDIIRSDDGSPAWGRHRTISGQGHARISTGIRS